MARGSHSRRDSGAVVQGGVEAETGPGESTPPGGETEGLHGPGASESVPRDPKQIRGGGGAVSGGAWRR